MRLADLPIPPAAEERTWRTLESAFGARTPCPRKRLTGPSIPVAAAAAGVALVATAVALSAAGSGVITNLRNAIGVRRSTALLVRLPSPGRLLLNSSSGPWIVNPDGSKRHLGGASETQASWSPHGLYEAVVIDRRQLAAIDPKGAIRWSLGRAAVSDPRWSADGYRIAYRSGSSLRVVAGDGTGDHLLASQTAPIAAAWEGATHRLAYADPAGAVHLVDADTTKTVWISRPGPAATALAWEPGARRLIVLTNDSIRILDAGNGALAGRIPIGSGNHMLAVSPLGTLAVTATSTTGQSTILLLHPLQPQLKPRSVFQGAGKFSGLTWSPDGAWLLASWATADQWVFINLDARHQAAKRVQAVSSIARQFTADQAPELSGWCCSADLPPP